MAARSKAANDCVRRHPFAALTLAAVLLLLPIAAASALHANAARSRHRGVPAPRLHRKPAKRTTKTVAYFTFTDRTRGVHFQCSLDRARFTRCSHSKFFGPKTVRRHCPKAKRHAGSHQRRRCKASTRVVGRQLKVGNHRFRVRAVTRSGRVSHAAVYRWTIFVPTPPPVQGLPFTITTTGTGEPLYPGGPPENVPLTIQNPNAEPLYVTSLAVSVSNSPPGCDGAQNLLIVQSSASETTPVVVPANGSATLPTQGVTAPTVQMLELPVNQDECEGAAFRFSYSGTGRS